MADPRQPHAPDEDTHMADRPPYPGTPRWVKVSGIIALVLVLLFLGLHFAGGGPMRFMQHGPGGQMPSMQHGVQRP